MNASEWLAIIWYMAILIFAFEVFIGYDLGYSYVNITLLNACRDKPAVPLFRLLLQ
jgi:hypothetical protein